MEKIEDRIVYTPFELDFFVDVVQTEEENGTFDRLVELSLESNHIKEYRGKKFAVKIEDLKWVKNPVKIKKFRFNPRLGFAGEFTNEDLSPAVDISFFSYGRTKRDMDWRFLALSVGGDKNKVNFGVTPVQWNFGNVVPLVENAFVGPVVVGDTDGEVSYGGTLSIPF
ncbi:MAG: hypothetical protein KKH68_07055, partial [Proteobacteria bacterium]|nr:hypothetical protein [Pseudomonadota bacterium]